MTTNDALTAALLQQGTASQLSALFETLIQRLPIKIAIWHLEDQHDPASLRLAMVNYSTSALNSRIDMRAEVGKPIKQVLSGVSDALLQRYMDVLRSGQAMTLSEMSYVDERMGSVVLNIQAIPISHQYLCIVVEDVTSKKQAEEALRQTAQHEETIRAQQAMLAELSTPLIPINDRVVIMPLIGTVDSRRAQLVIETLLEGISSSRARFAILDITGVPVVDTQVANALIRAAQAVKLLGAEVILTGIRPEIAQTLVGLGTDLTGIITQSSLQSGIVFATSHS